RVVFEQDHGIAGITPLAGDLGYPVELRGGQLAEQRHLLEDGRYRHDGFPLTRGGVEWWGKLTYKRSCCQFGAPPGACRQLMAPVIFPHFWSVDFQSRIVCCETRNPPRLPPRDRKSTRLNSSHLGISYAVF